MLPPGPTVTPLEVDFVGRIQRGLRLKRNRSQWPGRNDAESAMHGGEFEQALSADGKHCLSFEVPAGRNRAAVCLPVTVIRHVPGPCVLFTGGNHGDEYEGPFAIMRMIRELSRDDLVCGTVILMPMLNPPAVDAGTRVSPIDGKNLNRVFPGNPRGTATDRAGGCQH